MATVRIPLPSDFCCNPPFVPPVCDEITLIATDPLDGAMNVPASSNIVFDFDQDVSLVSATLTSDSQGTCGAPIAADPIAFTSSVTGPTVTLNPDADMPGFPTTATVIVENDCGNQLTVSICFTVTGA